MNLATLVQDRLMTYYCNVFPSGLCLPFDNDVPELDKVPSPLSFLRDWCGPNKPFVVRGAAENWLAVKRWTPDFFR